VQTVLNTRVLVIDDEEVVRDSIREVLLPKRRDTTGLDAAASALFDDDEVPEVAPPPRSKLPGIGIEIDLSEAGSGQEALEKINASAEAGRPFAVIFLDMRMPGWDGLETAKRIRAIDRAAEIIFVTAYSDYGLDEIVAEAGSNVGFHCKPFAPEEIRQIASKGIYDWNKIHNLELLIQGMGRLRSDRAEIETLLQNVLQQVSDWVCTSSALIARGGSALEFAPLAGCGPLGDPQRSERLLRQLGGKALPSGNFRFEGTSFCIVAEGDIIVVWEDEGRINPEKSYLLRLFVEHASQVIENAQLHEQVLLGVKLSAIGRAIGTVAHDIRSPIGGIQSALDVVRMDLDDKAQVAEMLDLIGQSADDAMSLVEDILDYTKRSTIEKQPLRAEDLLERVRRQTREVVALHLVRLTIECEGGLGLIGEARKLERVLINLIGNAAEALGSHRGLSPAIAVMAWSSDGKASITVSDNGPGIPARIRPTLFEPFVTHGKAGGTGLGLAIASQIVEAHGGRLSFTTGQEGTTFLVEIPQSRAADTSVEAELPPGTPSRSARLGVPA